MKTKEQELTLLGLQEINDSEKNEVTGGVIRDFGPIIILGPIIFCCIDIPPAPIGDWVLY